MCALGGAVNLPLGARTYLTLEVEAGAEPLLGAKLKLDHATKVIVVPAHPCRCRAPGKSIGRGRGGAGKGKIKARGESEEEKGYERGES